MRTRAKSRIDGIRYDSIATRGRFCGRSRSIHVISENSIGGRREELTLNVDDGAFHPTAFASGTKDMAITRVGQADIGLCILAEAYGSEETG